MHAISSYRDNRPNHKQKGLITIHCAAASAQCNKWCTVCVCVCVRVCTLALITDLSFKQIFANIFSLVSLIISNHSKRLDILQYTHTHIHTHTHTHNYHCEVII